MDTATINRLAAAPLLPLLQALGSSYASLPSAADSVSLLHKRGVSTFFSFYVDADPVEPSRYSLTMEQGGMSLPTKDYYVKQTARYSNVRSAFQLFVKNVFYSMAQEAALRDVLAPLFTTESADQAAADVFDVEMQIANVSNFNDELRNSEAMYNPTTLSAMTAPGLFSFSQWARGLSSAPALSEVITTTRTYFPAISSIITRLATTQPLKLKRYMTWRAVQPALPYLSTTYVDLNFKFFGQLLSGARVRTHPILLLICSVSFARSGTNPPLNVLCDHRQQPPRF
jgi:predicted metalloendopeptidase